MAESNAWHKPYRYEQPTYGAFGVLDEVGGRVVCHVCGRAFRTLAPHISRMHGLTADDYREAFGLNRQQSLVSASYSRGLGATIKRLGNVRTIRQYSRPGPLREASLAKAVQVAAEPRRVQAAINSIEGRRKMSQSATVRMKEVWAVYRAAKRDGAP